jgi:hypothetical protein
MRRQESFPWIIVMGGAVLYWTIALGIGIPSLYRVLGPPGPAQRARPSVEARCVQAVAVDGTPIVFGDCFNVRFVHDSPELARPRGTHPTIDRQQCFGSAHAGGNTEIADPDLVVTPPTWQPTSAEQPMHNVHHDQQQPEASDSVGRTSY